MSHASPVDSNLMNSDEQVSGLRKSASLWLMSHFSLLQLYFVTSCKRLSDSMTRSCLLLLVPDMQTKIRCTGMIVVHDLDDADRWQPNDRSGERRCSNEPRLTQKLLHLLFFPQTGTHVPALVSCSRLHDQKRILTTNVQLFLLFSFFFTRTGASGMVQND